MFSELQDSKVVCFRGLSGFLHGYKDPLPLNFGTLNP